MFVQSFYEFFYVLSSPPRTINSMVEKLKTNYKNSFTAMPSPKRALWQTNDEQTAESGVINASDGNRSRLPHRGAKESYDTEESQVVLQTTGII